VAVLYKFLLHKEDKETEFLPQNVTEFIVCNIYGVHDIGCKDIKVRKSLLVAKTHSNHAKVVCIFSLLDFSFIILFEKRFPYSEKLQCFFSVSCKFILHAPKNQKDFSWLDFRLHSVTA